MSDCWGIQTPPACPSDDLHCTLPRRSWANTWPVNGAMRDMHWRVAALARSCSTLNIAIDCKRSRPARLSIIRCADVYLVTSFFMVRSPRCAIVDSVLAVSLVAQTLYRCSKNRQVATSVKSISPSKLKGQPSCWSRSCLAVAGPATDSRALTLTQTEPGCVAPALLWRA